MVTGYYPSSSWKWSDNFSNQRAWLTIQKGLPLTWRWSSIHLSVLSRPSGSQNSYQSYQSIWPLWADQGGRRFRELGTGSELWFYLGPGNQCRVARIHISSAEAWLGFHKVMSLGWCAPFREALGSSAWFSHFMTESGDRLTHFLAVCQGSYRLSA